MIVQGEIMYSRNGIEKSIPYSIMEQDEYDPDEQEIDVSLSLVIGNTGIIEIAVDNDGSAIVDVSADGRPQLEFYLTDKTAGLFAPESIAKCNHDDQYIKRAIDNERTCCGSLEVVSDCTICGRHWVEEYTLTSIAEE